MIVVGDEKRSKDHIPIACKDAVAILFMFDLTSRSTLNRFFFFLNFFINLPVFFLLAVTIFIFKNVVILFCFDLQCLRVV